jgi:hypothetical protein
MKKKKKKKLHANDDEESSSLVPRRSKHIMTIFQSLTKSRGDSNSKCAREIDSRCTESDKFIRSLAASIVES